MRAVSRTDKAVERPRPVRQDGKGDCEVGAVCGEPVGFGEGHHSDSCITEMGEMVAHGDHMFLAGQSSEVAVEDQDDRSASVLGQRPGAAVLIDEIHIWHGLANTQ